MKTIFTSKHEKILSFIDALNWFAADIQILLT